MTISRHNTKLKHMETDICCKADNFNTCFCNGTGYNHNALQSFTTLGILDDKGKDKYHTIQN